MRWLVPLVRLAGLAIATASASSAPPAAYTLVFTDGHFNMSGAPAIKCGGDGTMPFWIQTAQFDASGSTLVAPPKDFTTELCGAGYLSVHPNRSALLVASMDLTTPGNIGNVATYVVDLALKAPQTPRPAFADLSPLLAACGAGVCVEASTFHGTFSPAGDRIVFAYRVWDHDETGVGNQALATADADGANVKPLTFTTAGAYKGINIIDMCPAPTRGDPSSVFFLRSLDQGMSMFAARVEVATGKVDVLLALPEYAISSGCANFVETADGVTVMYMGCAGSLANCSFSARSASASVVRAEKRDARAAWGTANAMPLPGSPAANHTQYNYGTVKLPKGAAPEKLAFAPTFNVPLTTTPDTIGSYAITQCDQVHGAADSRLITCEGADPDHSFTQMVLVDSQTGANVSAISYNTFRECMTPRCSLLMTV